MSCKCFTLEMAIEKVKSELESLDEGTLRYSEIIQGLGLEFVKVSSDEFSKVYEDKLNLVEENDRLTKIIENARWELDAI